MFSIRIGEKKLSLFAFGTLFFLLFLFLFVSCVGVPSQNTHVFNTDKTINEIWRIVYETPLSPQSAPKYPDCIKKYFSYYGFDFEGVNHYFGSFRSNDYLIAAHLFVPRFALETVYLVHGYLMHSGYFNLFIKELLDHNVAVAVFDLPGHGFSSGEMADINSFSEYADVIHDFLNKTKDTFIPPPAAIVGHSTGGAAVIEYMLKYESVFQRHFLSSPLIRSKMWGLSKFGFSLFHGGIQSVPALIGDTSSDLEYIKFLKNEEPLRRERVPLSWVNALIEWNNKLISTDKVIQKEILVFQGTSDTVVDWNYNMKFIPQLFPRAEIVYVEGAKHDLFQEKKEFREQVFNRIIEELEKRQY
ncbi:MAG: alpha/beta hydrolase [Spirochaetales bacterium]|nr:alpha/beta hydrolase [Spirochaetales bacterium]